MTRRRWLTGRALIAIHDELIARYGGVPGLRDAGALDSAMTRPRHLAHYAPRTSVPKLAAAYAWGILKNHPFVDGNKRAALAALLVFLDLNGWEWTASEVEETGMVLVAAADEIHEDEWNDWVELSSKRKRH